MMHAWGAVDLRIYLAKKNHGYSISAQSYDFCPHLIKLDILDFTLSRMRKGDGHISYCFDSDLILTPCVSGRHSRKSELFTNSAPLGRVGHRVAMSVCVCVCVSVCLRHRVQFFSRPLIGPQIT